MLQRRFFCTKNQQWTVKQVTKSNFSEALEEMKGHIFDTDFIAVSLQKTGSFSAPWHRVTPFDSAETAYRKVVNAAEKFQILQFAVCPFSVSASKVVAYPYNFHLFPRDELRIGKPSYSFACQTSYLTSMAQEGFDFNACIYDGISYLSREQESAAKNLIAGPITSKHAIVPPTFAISVADSVFIERIKSRVRNWRNTCKGLSTGTEDPLVSSLKNLILGTEVCGSRPSLSIDVCSERQVHLVLKTLRECFDDLVPLKVPAKGGGTLAIRVVLTSSKEDKNCLERELQKIEDDQNMQVRGFREVIDSISASRKLLVAHNSLNDFAFIYSKFLGQLPPSIEEFKCSLRDVFPLVFDVNHMMKQISPLKKMSSLPAAISYLNNRFFAPSDMEIPHQAKEKKEGKIHGHNVLKISHLFAKLCTILKITNGVNLSSKLESYANIFGPCSTNSQELTHEDITVYIDNKRKVRREDLVFLWGFRCGISASVLKSLLSGTYVVFAEEFEVRLLDKSCAILVFWKPGFSEKFIQEINSGGNRCESLRELVLEGARAAGYESYERVIGLGVWEADLADSFDKALADSVYSLETFSNSKPSDIYWDSDFKIDLDTL